MKRISFTALILLLFASLFCSTIEVGVNCTIKTITEAIQAAAPGDVIRVHDGLYQETLSIDKKLTIVSDYYYDQDESHIQNTSISSPSSEQAVVCDSDESEITITLAGLTVVGGNRAVKLDSNVKVNLLACNLYAQAESDVAVVVAQPTTTLKLRNSALNASNGKGVQATGANVEVTKCEIGSNESAGISFDGDNVATLSVANSILYSNQTGIDIRDAMGNVTLNHVTIADNLTGIRLRSSNLIVTNSIVYDNGTQLSNISGSCAVSYSDFEGGFGGEGNIDLDPLFDPGNNGSYDLRWDQYGKSPCIDSGDWTTAGDQDGTPPDMGAYTAVNHRFDIWSFPKADENGGWRWFCIPAVDNVLTYPVQNTADALFGGMIDMEILDQVKWNASNTLQSISLLDDEWTNLDHVVNPVQGYKIHMNENATLNYHLEVPGFNPDFNTVMQLSATTDNWIGYFLPETRLAVDLFDSIKDDVNYIKAQRWALERIDGEWIGDTDVSLNYGEMVVVSVHHTCNFQWDTDALISDPDAYPFPEHFDFTEKSEYVPFFIEYSPTFENEEIAITVDGVVKGASVVFGSLTQVNGYLADDDEDGYQGGSHMGEVDFIIWCPVRGNTRKIDDYYVYNESVRRVVHSKIDLADKRDFYYVSFDEESVIDAPPAMALTHYPNPFNPETTISYSLDHEDEVAVDIYNVKGQKVRTLVRGVQAEGAYQVTWQGDDNTGHPVASGIYFCRLKSGSQTLVRKMMMLK